MARHAQPDEMLEQFERCQNWMLRQTAIWRGHAGETRAARVDREKRLRELRARSRQLDRELDAYVARLKKNHLPGGGNMPGGGRLPGEGNVKKPE